ncbi:MAG: hypothetical protein HFE52_04245 [Clostridia bacterium]|nr:hypothetical protein [Clostridia bacterium]
MIEYILDKTECIPLYLEIAINIYKNLKKENSHIMREEFLCIKRKSDFIKVFIHHLPLDVQEIILILSVIQIFNQSIFEWLVLDLNLKISVLEYYDIMNLSLFSLLNKDLDLIKLHDVFAYNASKFIKKEKQIKIFRSYISYSAKRGVYEFTCDQLSSVFFNILSLSSKYSLVKTDIEMVCDIFFHLYEEYYVPELQQKVQNCESESLNDFKILVKCIYTDKYDPQLSYNTALNIQTNNSLGRHYKSLLLIQSYSYEIQGNYSEAKSIQKEIYKKLSEKDYSYWYYGKAHIFYADQLLMEGAFKQSIKILSDYCNNTLYGFHKRGEFFEAKKHIAHNKRFNMFLEDADILYEKLQYENEDIHIFLAYALTCRCETNCYFNPNFVLEFAPTALELCDELNLPKDKAKIYYSLAISEMQKHNFEVASYYIEKSLESNTIASYMSGMLFAKMAELYLEYAKYGIIQQDIQNDIANIIDEIGVYKYFELPISILTKNNENLIKLKDDFEWIDFNYTKKRYIEFFNKLR